jgi:hypothetical protein
MTLPHETSLLKALTICFATACALICTGSTANAQNIQFTQGSVGSGLDNTVQVSLWTYPGRGAASLPVTLTSEDCGRLTVRPCKTPQAMETTARLREERVFQPTYPEVFRK